MTKPTEFEDAEFEMVADDAPSRDVDRAKTQAAPPVAPVSDEAERVALGAFGKAAKPKLQERMSLPMFTLVGVSVSVIAFSIGAAYAYLVAPADPMMGVSHNDAIAAGQSQFGGLVLSEFAFESGLSNGREFISVDGVIINQGEQPMVVPAMRLLFGPEGETKARYRIDRGETLMPGEQIVFTSRIPLRDTEPVSPTLEFIQ